MNNFFGYKLFSRIFFNCSRVIVIFEIGIPIFLYLQALWEYYNLNTIRSRSRGVVDFTATARILDGRRAIYNGQAPVVASYSSRGPDVNNALLQTADVLKPNIMAPGSSIWAAWSPNSEGDEFMKGITETSFHLMLNAISRIR